MLSSSGRLTSREYVIPGVSVRPNLLILSLSRLTSLAILVYQAKRGRSTIAEYT